MKFTRRGFLAGAAAIVPAVTAVGMSEPRSLFDRIKSAVRGAKPTASGSYVMVSPPNSLAALYQYEINKRRMAEVEMVARSLDRSWLPANSGEIGHFEGVRFIDEGNA